MTDFRLKIILSALLALVFSLIFILLAFILPVDKKEVKIINHHKGKLEQISDSLKN
ncbi:hypothetical protein [Sulfurimonas sp.]|uniref:hypothetical protein n=1 Tax=Sulfurimonas sp. TaxID=2022749 RepID=UPI002601EE90|nr:hypothetical protein [Sulfurimonas sp.]